jgi:hypothetical protein
MLRELSLPKMESCAVSLQPQRMQDLAQRVLPLPVQQLLLVQESQAQIQSVRGRYLMEQHRTLPRGVL